MNEIEQQKKEENEKLNKIKEELKNVYNTNGKVNVIEFYEKNINQKNYDTPNSQNLNNIHINIGFSDVNINLIIKHISSILYKAASTTFIHIHMMDAGDFCYDTLIKLKNMICRINNSTEIIVYDARQSLKDFLIRADSTSKFSPEYAKLYAFKVIRDVKKIIFLDADDCIVQKDLNELYSINMDNIYARGISEEPSIRYSMNWMDKYLYDRTHYINGGVMLINMELCQKEDFYEKAVKLNNDVFYTKTEEPAQDILNVLMRRKIEFFHPKYNKFNFYENPDDINDKSKWYPWMEQTLALGNRNNHFYTREELIEADKDPVIIHYIWDRYLNKVIKKYEEDKNFYANLTGINNE
jgi:lipopolysaccharide biosynthesis glycosyltransferase